MALTRICLDTCTYSQFKRGESQAIEAVCSAKEICMPTIVLGELRTGFKLGRYKKRNENELQDFLSSPVVRILDIDDEATFHYAEIVAKLRTAGIPIPTNDIWIAALAAREGTIVVTYDNHYALIDRIDTRILELN